MYHDMVNTFHTVEQRHKEHAFDRTLPKTYLNTGFIWSMYSYIQTEYRNIWAISPNIPVFGINRAIYGAEKTSMSVSFKQWGLLRDVCWY